MLPDYERIAGQFELRQARKGQAEKLFIQLTGLEMKLEQYRVGESFVDHIVRQRGIGFMNRVWECADNLPTLSEIHNPGSWVQRMEC
jgi:uncharacterized protein (DUF2342 family)